MPKPHRIFVAINLPEQTKEKLAQFQKNWPTFPCKWLKKETFHITLAFLGNRNEQEIEKIFEAVKQVGKTHNPFSISLNRICYGPLRQNKFGAGRAPKIIPPRLVWAEGKPSENLLKLKLDLDNLLAEKINFVPEKRKTTPHITLARIKKWNWQRIEPDERPDVNLNIFFKIPINSIEVMEAHLKPTGAEYTTLKSFVLASTPDD